MTQTVQLRRSSTDGAKPTTAQLELGEMAINTYDGKVYIKKSVSGVESIVQVGEASTSQFTSYQHCKFSNAGGTLSAGQTSFSGTDDNSASLGYTAGNLIVFLNGVALDPDDFTATNGTTIVLDNAVAGSDTLETVSMGGDSGSALTSVAIYEYTATANQTAFTGADDNSRTLSYDSGEELVFLNGVLLDPRTSQDYTRTSSSTITLNAGAQVNDTLVIKTYGGSNPFNRFTFDVTAASTTSITGTDANSVTLSFHPDYSEVFVNGILMQKGQWTGGDGKTISFTDALVDPNYIIDVIDYQITAPQVRLFKDEAPFLGGHLNTNGKEIVGSSGQNITFTPASSQYVDIKDGPLRMDILSSDPSTVTDRASLYSKEISSMAELFVQDEAGNVTQISPHQDGEWVYYSENIKTGKRFKVNMERMIRKLQDITGERFIEIDE